MTRVRIAICILAALILLSAGSVYAVRRSCRHVMNTLDQISVAEAHGDIQEAEELCEIAEKRWEKMQYVLMFCVSYDKLIEAENSIRRLKPLLDAECDEFTAELALSQSMILSISDGETPYITNVF